MSTLDLTTPETPQTESDWRARVTRDLKGADFDRRLVTPTLEGIAVQPIYDRAPADGPLSRPSGRGWLIASEVDAPDPTRAAAAIATDLAFGAQALRLVSDVSVRLGGSPGGDGVVLDGPEAFAKTLDAVDLTQIVVAFQAGGRGHQFAEMLGAYAERRGVALSDLKGELGVDPLGALAADGALPIAVATALDDLRATARWAVDKAPGLRTARVSVAPHQEAGAHWGQALAWALGTAVTYLRAMTEGEGALTVEEAAGQIAFEVAVGRDLFMAAAGMRALRHLWRRALQACGCDPVPDAFIHGRTARHTLSRRDARVNMLRTTGAAFAAIIGGADSVAVIPFDRPLGAPTDDARRHALHIQHLLDEESHLGAVADPAGGSAYVEALTDALCAQGWSGLQEIEAEGGMVRRVLSGRVAAAAAETATARRRRIFSRRDPLVGVSAFPWLDEPSAGGRPRPRPDPNEDSLTDEPPGPGAVVAPALAPFREAHEFEYLRDMSDAALANTGRRPSAFLANIGALARYKARADFSAQLLAAGGVATVDAGGFSAPQAAAAAFTQAEVPVAVICGHDEDYAAQAVAFAEALKAAGAKRIIMARRPGEDADALKAAGVDTFIHLGVDMLAVLGPLMEEICK